MTTNLNTFAIGDVHGRADLLQALLARIAEDSAVECCDYRIIFLGDIIDCGPETREALALVARTLEERPGSQLILGNHETFLLKFIDNPEDDANLRAWISNGGADTIHSYRFLLCQSPQLLHIDFEDLFPHVNMLRNAASFIETDRHIFVHAGLRPGVPLLEQSDRDLRWIRDDFLCSDYDFGKMIVHGHSWTPSGQPEVHHNRIAIDTGATETGRLTAMRLDILGEVSFLCTEETDIGIIVQATKGQLITKPGSSIGAR